MPGRRVARAWEAPSRDALRGILRGDAKRALDCAEPAPGSGHTHEAHHGYRGERVSAQLLRGVSAGRFFCIVRPADKAILCLA